MKDKGEAILQAIRNGEVGSDVIIHNLDGSIWCVITIKAKEHNEVSDKKEVNVESLSVAIKDLIKDAINEEVIRHLNIAYFLQKQEEERPNKIGE